MNLGKAILFLVVGSAVIMAVDFILLLAWGTFLLF